MGETTDDLIAMLDSEIQNWLEEVQEDFLDTRGAPPPPIPQRNPRRLGKRQGPIPKLIRSDANIVPQDSTQASTEQKGTEEVKLSNKTKPAATQVSADSDENSHPAEI
ncbi:uncharacterized protein PG998_013771 [Apiospora kogelbergensis]|uniref:Uncharacterized protein n=1 Tax=Apiospora kogelbergensis TaxID=1337665 RepID=A0AAW0R0H3_9PEZI